MPFEPHCTRPTLTDPPAIAINIKQRRRKIDQSIVANDLPQTIKLLLSFVYDFDKGRKYYELAMQIATRSYVLEELASTKNGKLNASQVCKEKCAIYEDMLLVLSKICPPSPSQIETRITPSDFPCFYDDATRLMTRFAEQPTRHLMALKTFLHKYATAGSSRTELILLRWLASDVFSNKTSLNSITSDQLKKLRTKGLSLLRQIVLSVAQSSLDGLVRSKKSTLPINSKRAVHS